MDFTQCTRKRKDGTEFCGSHQKNLPNGKIGDEGSNELGVGIPFSRKKFESFSLSWQIEIVSELFM